jgi:hypothetical protein
MQERQSFLDTWRCWQRRRFFTLVGSSNRLAFVRPKYGSPNKYFEIRKRSAAGIFTVASPNSRKSRGGSLSVIGQSSLHEAFCCCFNCDEFALVQCLYRSQTRERALWGCEKKPFTTTGYIAKGPLQLMQAQLPKGSVTYAVVETTPTGIDGTLVDSAVFLISR